MLTDSAHELHKLLTDPKLEVGAINYINKALVSVPWKKRREWVASHSKYNVVLALWTTSAARLVLLDAMEAVERTPGMKGLYTDTDSIFVLHERDQPMPFKVGEFLGEMKKGVNIF